MNPQEQTAVIAAVVGVVVALMGALQAWLIARSNKHEIALNGVLSGRITAGAVAAIDADKAAQSVPVVAASSTDPVKAARAAALRKELATLE